MRFATLCTVLFCCVYFSVINTDYIPEKQESIFWLKDTAVFSNMQELNFSQINISFKNQDVSSPVGTAVV